MKKTINLDPTDFSSILKIMDEHGDSKTMLTGINEDGESAWISPYPDRVVVKTFQANGWTRINTYWRDGTYEETFDGRWDKIVEEDAPMKEYKIQARYPTRSKGKWVSARFINGTSCPVYTDKKTAEKCVEQLRKTWPGFVESWNKGTPKKYVEEAPIDFRILSREVTEWEPEQE